MQSSFIETLKTDFDDISSYLQSNNQYSLAISINNNYRKNLILSVASYFETEITSIILDYVRICTKDDEMLISFVETKALARQYHTLFDWDAKNCNKFFKWFGESAKETMRSNIEKNKLDQSELDFIAIGSQRNQLVHRNFAEAVINDTFDDIYRRYVSACSFIELLRKYLLQEKKET
jgi:uncharacterized protein YozE (UPF0346 family)